MHDFHVYGDYIRKLCMIFDNIYVFSDWQKKELDFIINVLVASASENLTAMWGSIFLND
jgi:hypothetical protein